MHGDRTDFAIGDHTAASVAAAAPVAAAAAAPEFPEFSNRNVGELGFDLFFSGALFASLATASSPKRVRARTWYRKTHYDAMCRRLAVTAVHAAGVAQQGSSSRGFATLRSLLSGVLRPLSHLSFVLPLHCLSLSLSLSLSHSFSLAPYLLCIYSLNLLSLCCRSSSLSLSPPLSLALCLSLWLAHVCLFSSVYGGFSPSRFLMVPEIPYSSPNCGAEPVLGRVALWRAVLSTTVIILETIQAGSTTAATW